MRRALCAAALAALLVAPAAPTERTRPAYYVIPTDGRLYFAFNLRHPPLDDPQLRQAVVLALDHASLARAAPRFARQTIVPLEPKYAAPESVARARELAAPWAGTRLVVRWGRGRPPFFDVLSYQLGQIGLQLGVQPSPGGVDPDLYADVALWNVREDYPTQRPEDQLRNAFNGGPIAFVPIGRAVDHVFVSARVGPVTYNRVYGLDLAALSLR